MWIFCNPNPCHVLVGDCAIRACTIQLDSNWHRVHRDLCDLSDVECNTIGTGSHAVTVIDGDWYDIWDSGDEYVSYYFERS